MGSHVACDITIPQPVRVVCLCFKPEFCWAEMTWFPAVRSTGSRGAMFVVGTSKPVENLRKNGLLWSRYSFVTHSIDRKPRDWGLARSAYSIKYGKSFLLLGTSCLGRPSGDVPCAGEDMACGHRFSKVDHRLARTSWLNAIYTTSPQCLASTCNSCTWPSFTVLFTVDL